MIQSVLKRIPGLSRLGITGGSELQRLLVKAASGSFALRIANTGLMFLISVILARILGAAGFGAYSYALAWLGLLSVPAVLGFEQLLIRNVSIYNSQAFWQLMRGLLRRSNQAVFVASALVAIIAALSASALAGRFEQSVLYTFWVAVALLPLTALARVRQAALRGLYRVVSGQSPEMLVQPLLLIALIFGTYAILGGELNAPLAMGLNGIALLAAFLFGAWMLKRNLPRGVSEALPAYENRAWLIGALPLVLVSGAQIINTRADIIMLGVLEGASSAGIYTVASRGADLIMFVIFAANAALGPTFASLYSAGELDRLQRLVTKSARLTFLASLPLALGFLAFGWWFMLIFGSEFTQGATALGILSVGRLASTAVGSVGILLVMTGHERYAAAGVGIGAVLNILLNALLIPAFGLEGAATATATSLIVWNLLVAVWVYKNLGIYPTIVGRMKRE